jgi:hypothetical protein
VARFDDKKRVCLNTAAFIPIHGFDEKAYYFGHNLHDHAAAATSNLLQEKQPCLERSVYYDELSADSIKILAEKSEYFGMESLLAINKEAIELEKNDAPKKGPRHRMTFGIYYFSEPIESRIIAEKKDDAHISV